MRKWTPSVVAFAVVWASLHALLACAPSSRSAWQEPVADVTFLPHGAENPVAFGASLHDHPEWRAAAVATIDSTVAGRLPGVRFYVVRYPVLAPPANTPVHSYRDGDAGLVVLSWWLEGDRFVVGDVPWEVSHLVSVTDDAGRPLR